MMIFPLTEPVFEHQFGVRAIADGEPLWANDEFFHDHVILKRLLINDDAANYVALTPDCGDAIVEATQWMCRSKPISDELIQASDDAVLRFVNATLGVQEDIVICRGTGDFEVVAGVVCFPSGWTIAEKIGLPLHEVHGPVPGFAEAMGNATSTLMARLKVDRPVWRTNWGVRAANQWDQSPKHADAIERQVDEITDDNAGAKCHFRVERQTLTRLPQTGDIAFTIHTMQCPVGNLTDDQQRILRGVLETCPAETLEYKGIAPFADRLCGWLGAEAEK